MLYGYPDAWSSYITIRIDGIDYYQDSTMDLYVTQAPTIIGDSIVTKWTLPLNVNVSQNLTLMPNTTKYCLTVINNDYANHNIKIRLLFDTMLAYNDGAPFRVPGVGDITTEQEFINPVFNSWLATDSLANPTLTSNCTFVPGNKPYKVQFAYWWDIYDEPFDYTITEGRDITSDTAVGMYWDLGTLAPGETKNVIVYYGISGPIIGAPEIEIINLFTEFDNYLPNQTVNIFADIGNGGDTPLVDGQFIINITNPAGEVVFENVSYITISPDQIISRSFAYNLPVDALTGVYTINAAVYDAEMNLLDTKKTTFSVREFNLSISPENITTSIGGRAIYEIKVKNPGDIPISLDLSLSGLNETWYTLSKESLILNAGEEEEVMLNITVPESPNSVGEYLFNVFADSKSVSAVLNVVLEPIIYELSPPDNVVMSSNDIIFSWKTSVNSTTELYIKPETEDDFTQVIGESGLEHSVTVENLTRNMNYTWYIKSCSAFGCSISENRTFYIDNGIVFTQDIYEFNIERDYNQHCFVSVKNTDSEAHDLLVRAFNPYEDLYFGFIGNGSADRIISLAPGETREIELVIHAQDAMLENYIFMVNLTNLGAENITDYALVCVNVRHPHIDFNITEVSTDPITLSKTIRITNYGDPLTDLTITPDEKLKGKVIIQPSLTHCSLGTGESVDIVVTPIWSEDIQYIHGTIVATAANQSKELFVDYSCPEGKEMYPITLDNPLLYFDLKGAWCINRHHVEDTFNLPPGFGKENVIYAYIGMELDARGGQTRPYNVWIRINDNLVGTLSNTFPKGYYQFDINSSYFHYATAGIAENKYTLDTDMPGSYYTPLSDVRVVMCLDELKLHICAESEEQAKEIAWSVPYIHKPSENITVNILSPEEGSSLTPLEPVLIKAEVLGDNGREKLCRINATFNNSHEVIWLVDDGKHNDGGADDGIYAAEWIPRILGETKITVNATNCRAFDSDNVTVSVGLPPAKIKINLNLTIEDAISSPVVYKAPGDIIDIVASVTNEGETEQDVNVIINITPYSYFNLVDSFIRDNFTDIDEEPIDCVELGNSRYSILIENLEPDAEKQVVFRLNISEYAPPARYKVGGEARVEGELYGSDLETFDIVDNIPAIIVTNRHLLYKKYGYELKSQNPDSVKDVKSLLKYLYEVADGKDSGEKRCIVYYVDHYNETAKNWNQDVDYTNENTANRVANIIDNYIEEWAEKTNPKYLMIVGGDEVIPFYRYKDPKNDEKEWYIEYAGSNPRLIAGNYNYYFTDNPYGDTKGNDWDQGYLEIAIGRILGESINDMKNLIENGIGNPEHTGRAILTSCSGWELGFLPDKDGKNPDYCNVSKLFVDKGFEVKNDDESPRTIESDIWKESDLISISNGGMDVFMIGGHDNFWIACIPPEDYCISDPDDEFTMDDINSGRYTRFDIDKPIVVIPGCHGGAAVPKPEGGANRDLVFGLVRHNVSAYIGAQGYSYGTPNDYDNCIWGEYLIQLFYSKLLASMKQTNTLGEALRWAKYNYPFGKQHPTVGASDSVDKKTVTEYCLYGVPWHKITYPTKNKSSASFAKANIMQLNKQIKISETKQTLNQQYFKTIEIKNLTYNITKIDGYDIISIEPICKLSYKQGCPVVPYIEVYSLPLPEDANITNISIVSSSSQSIGNYKVPIADIKPFSQGGLSFTNKTNITGFYPQNLTEYEKTSGGYVFYIYPIKINPQTHETIFYQNITINIVYQTPTPITITDFSPSKTEYVTGEPINASLTVENVGADTLTGLRANLSLKDQYGKVRASSLSAPFDVASGESKTVYVTLSQNLPHGSYLAEIKVVNSTGYVLGSSSEDIFISSGGIVDFFLPSEVVSGENITFNITFKNDNATDVEAIGVVHIYDPHDMKIAELHSAPIDIAANSTGTMNITWSTAGREIGSYIASAVVLVGEETFGPVSKTFEILPGINISLYAGWNMISLPLKPADLSASSVLATIPNAGGIAYLWNASKGAYDAIYGDMELELGRAYWITIVSDGTWTPSGIEVSGVQVNLTPGWNMIGIPSRTNVSATDIIVTVGANSYNLVDAVHNRYIGGIFYSWDTVHGEWNATVISNTTMLKPGIGYFAKANQECTITYP